MNRARRLSALLVRLEGGTLRSLGDANAITADVLNDRSLLAEVFDAALSDDPVVRMRAADIAEKVTRAARGKKLLARLALPAVPHLQRSRGPVRK